jgi:hypothetical protein
MVNICLIKKYNKTFIMDSIFIIRSITSDYEGSNGTVGWVETKEQAIEKAKHMNEVHELAEKYKNQVWDYRNRIYDTIPKEELEQVPSYPKWPAGLAEKLITKEMRDERETIKQLQVEIGERNDIKYKKRNDEIERLTNEFQDSLNLTPEVLKAFFYVEHISYYDWFELEKL